jgi:hypothetical protein
MENQITVTKPTEEELEKLAVKSWPTWSCGVSEFPWEYDSRESCYILEGEVEVTAGDETVRFGPGDFVVFPAGLQCTWKVLRPVRKHYRLG